MPYLKIQTNVSRSGEQQKRLAERASGVVSAVLGKSEDYVMVAVEDKVTMCFAAGDAPAAYLELHSIGLTAEQAKACVEELSGPVGAWLGVAADRMYVNCRNAERTMWGWNGKTFG